MLSTISTGAIGTSLGIAITNLPHGQIVGFCCVGVAALYAAPAVISAIVDAISGAAFWD